MNCEVAQERIVLAVWGELADEQVHELERHLAICPECGREREQVKALKTLTSVYAVAEPDANLLARAHMRLDDALDALPAKNWFERMRARLGGGLNGLRAAPLAAALLLAAGICGGGLGGYQLAAHRAQSGVQALPAALQTAKADSNPSAKTAQLVPKPEMDKVANVSEVVKVPNSRMVDVSYNQMVPRQVRGSLDDPSIQQLLSLASQRPASTGVRDNSVDLLAAECRAGRGCNEPGVRNALLLALRYGQDEEVREKALQGLEPLVAEDIRVRNAILETLMNDSDPRIRSISINVLQPVEGDTSVREVLYTISTQDENPQIRDVSRQMLNRVPEIQ
jgi:anti-sigma factor RsiW